MTKRFLLFFILLPATGLLLQNALMAQVGNHAGQDANGVVSRQSHDVVITVGDEGNLAIKEHVLEETQYFNDNAGLYSEQSIGYSGSFSSVSGIEAYTLLPTGKNKFKKLTVDNFTVSDSRSSGVFYDDQKKVGFVFPALQAGAKTVLKYVKTYKEPRLWGYYIFSSYLPVKASSFSVTAPAGVRLQYRLFGDEDGKVSFSQEKKGKKMIYRWNADDLEEIRSGRNAGGILQRALHLIIYVQSYEVDGVAHHVLGDVKDLYAWYTSFLNDPEEEQSKQMEAVVAAITRDKKDELDKVQAIYYWVQQNIKYIAIEDGLGGFRPRDAGTVFKRRYGDCKDMSNLLREMLDIASIPASLAWTGTNSIPYSHREVPTPMADNHMICTYKKGGKFFFLDATGRYNVLGTPTEHIQGSEALVYKTVNDFELVEVPVVEPGKNITIDSVTITINDDAIRGVGKEVFSGYARVPVVYNLENLERSDKKVYLNDLLKKGNNKFMLDKVKTTNASGIHENLEIEYGFTVEDYAIRTQKEIFINPHLEKIEPDGLIDSPSVRQDIFYPYKFLTTGIVRIGVPDGYKVSYLPMNREYKSSEFGFSLRYHVDEKMVVVRQNFMLNTLKLEREQFDEWNEMIKSLYSAYKETIVLEKD